MSEFGLKDTADIAEKLLDGKGVHVMHKAGVFSVFNLTPFELEGRIFARPSKGFGSLPKKEKEEFVRSLAEEGVVITTSETVLWIKFFVYYKGTSFVRTIDVCSERTRVFWSILKELGKSDVLILKTGVDQKVCTKITSKGLAAPCEAHFYLRVKDKDLHNCLRQAKNWF